MGVDPNDDVEIVILDPNFDTGIGWNRAGGAWTFVGGKAHFLSPGPLGSLWQIPGFLENFSYQLTFTLSNSNFTAGPNIGIRVTIGNHIIGVFNTDGIHVVLGQPTDATGAIFFTNNNCPIGDSCDLDTIEIVNLANYPEAELEILYREPRWVNVHEAVATDYYSSISCAHDNTSCLISYNI